MKILFCTKNDIFGALILNWILPRAASHDMTVLLSNKTRPVEMTVNELKLEKFLERDFPLEQIFPLLDTLKLHGECLTMQALTQRFEVPIRIVEQMNDPATEQWLRDWQPDIIVSARFSLIFNAPILAIPRYGAYNLHPGALPEFAGLFSPMRALMAGKSQIACTLHQMDTSIDTGPVYSISYLPSEPSKSVFWHIEKLYLLGLASLLVLFDDLQAGKTPQLQAQNRADYRYFSLPDQAEFAELQGLGLSLVCFDAYQAMLARFLPPLTGLSYPRN